MGERIVACDDESHITRAIKLKFSRAGYEVETAPDGRAGLEAILRDPPAAVITDCQMPHMNGIELCRAIRAEPSVGSIPVILLTAKGFELSEDELRQDVGISALLPKPFSPRLLLEQTQQLLEKDAVERESAG